MSPRLPLARRAALAGALVLVSIATAATSARADDQADTAALFSAWAGSEGPGCAVSVVRDGQATFQAAYGRANVETGTPNTVHTAFQIGSVSKQFTAFAIHLLAAEGRLSLQDDVRRYVPEMHAFYRPITLDQLLHHTSGLRDEWLLLLQGRRPEDAVSQHDTLRALFAQRELNFEPGSRFVYSNANYTLLALVVERVSGRSYPDFMKARVFEPLGMTDTYVQDDWRTVRGPTAQGYGSGPAGLERRLFPLSAYGAGNIYSSAADMAHWTANLIEPKVGSPELVAQMQRGVRSPEAPSRYGSGIELADYRGMVSLAHGGVAPGAAAHVMIVPSARFGVTVLCNVETNDTSRIAARIADLHLAKDLPAQPSAKPVVLSGTQLGRFAGHYREAGGPVFDLVVRDGRLTIGGAPLTPLNDHLFALDGAPVRFSFSSSEGPAAVMRIHDPDQDRIAPRIAPTPVADLTPAGMADYLGRYYSPELSTVLTVERRGEQMWLSGAAFETPMLQPAPDLRSVDGFYTPSTVGAVQFVRDASGRVAELSITNGRVIAVRFVRVALPDF